MSRNNGDDLLQLLKNIYPNVDVPQYFPDSWKSVSRAIIRLASYYTSEKMTITFPEHREMKKWNCNNAPAPEKVEIRIRDPMELIAEQCVYPIIYFLWKEHAHFYYRQKPILIMRRSSVIYCLKSGHVKT